MNPREQQKTQESLGCTSLAHMYLECPERW